MKTHSFESITEEQWRSGLSRHKCALCAYDYDDPVHCVSNWPLVVVIEDCHVPEFAPRILKAIESTPVETCQAAIVALAVYAEFGLRRERLN